MVGCIFNIHQCNCAMHVCAKSSFDCVIVRYGSSQRPTFHPCSPWSLQKLSGSSVLLGDLQSSTKVLARLPTFAVSVMEIYQFASLPPIQCCLSWWSCHCSFPTLSGGRGFLIPVMPLIIVYKIACQRMFQLSDPGVPRTFVEDCSLIPFCNESILNHANLYWTKSYACFIMQSYVTRGFLEIKSQFHVIIVAFFFILAVRVRTRIKNTWNPLQARKLKS